MVKKVQLLRFIAFCNCTLSLITYLICHTLDMWLVNIHPMNPNITINYVGIWYVCPLTMETCVDSFHAVQYSIQDNPGIPPTWVHVIRFTMTTALFIVGYAALIAFASMMNGSMLTPAIVLNSLADMLMYFNLCFLLPVGKTMIPDNYKWSKSYILNWIVTVCSSCSNGYIIKCFWHNCK